MVFSSRTWEALCSFQSAEIGVMSPEFCTDQGPSLQPPRAVKNRVPTSVTGEFPGSWRQGCVLALWRGSTTVTGSLHDKSTSTWSNIKLYILQFTKLVSFGSGFGENNYEPRLFLRSKGCLCWDNTLYKWRHRLQSFEGTRYRWKGSETRGQFVYCAELWGGGREGGKKKSKAGNDTDWDFCHRPCSSDSHILNAHCT